MEEVVVSDSYEGRDAIVMPSAIMEHLQKLSPTALRIYVYFCSCDRNGRITAAVPVIAKAVDQSNGTTVKALRELRKRGLISSDAGSGPNANAYQVTLRRSLLKATPVRCASCAAIGSAPTVAIPKAVGPLSREVGETSLQEAGTPETATTPPCSVHVSTTVRASEQSAATMEELLASCYRLLDPAEYAWLKTRFSDEVVLREKLTALLKSGGGVMPDLNVEFLARVLEHQVA